MKTRAKMVQQTLQETKLSELVRNLRRTKQIIVLEEAKYRNLVDETIELMEKLNKREIVVDGVVARLDVFETFSLEEDELIKVLNELEKQGTRLDVTEQVYSKEKIQHCINTGAIPSEMALKIFSRGIQKRLIPTVQTRKKR